MAERLFVAERGSGPPLVLLHGWGVNGGIWEPMALELAQQYRVLMVDLPGFGYSETPTEPDLRVWAGRVQASVPERAVWLGWSLGGMVALAGAAQHFPVGLVLVGTSPCFVQAEGWPDAIQARVLEEFANELDRDYKGTLLRFLTLQSRGSERAREEVRQLREQVFARGEPALGALKSGLEILRTGDLRPMLSGITQPALVVHGGRDRLVPVAAAERMVESLPCGQMVRIDRAGHAPFLSHPQVFLQTVERFLASLPGYG